MLIGRAIKAAVAFARSCIGGRGTSGKSKIGKVLYQGAHRHTFVGGSTSASRIQYLEGGWHLNRRDARAHQATQSLDTANNPK